MCLLEFYGDEDDVFSQILQWLKVGNLTGVSEKNLTGEYSICQMWE